MKNNKITIDSIKDYNYNDIKNIDVEIDKIDIQLYDSNKKISKLKKNLISKNYEWIKN